jgi:transcriptional regulator with XRE-family HTH domain
MSATDRAGHRWSEPVAQTVSPTPVPEQITRALDYRGLYGPEVDEACGVEEPTVDLWETGAVVPTEDQIRLLAALTHFPPSFFYRIPVEINAPMFMCGKHCEVIVPTPPISAEDRALARELRAVVQSRP